jgi:hypothetical protein
MNDMAMDELGPFDLFMGQHRPIGEVVSAIDRAIWELGALDPVIKERARIASADELGCGY